MSENGIGASMRRKEDRRFLTGNGNYLDDINVGGQTYAYFVRSPHAHAKIKSIDTAPAKSLDGVVDVLTGQQLADDGKLPWRRCRHGGLRPRQKASYFLGAPFRKKINSPMAKSERTRRPHR